jgi:hypothetical protein
MCGEDVDVNLGGGWGGWGGPFSFLERKKKSQKTFFFFVRG